MTDINSLIANITVAPLGEMYAKGIMDYHSTESMKLQNLQRKLQYQEQVKQVAVDALIRKRDTGALEYEIGQQPTRQKRASATENMTFDYQVAENEVREMKAASQSEEAYNKFIKNRLDNELPISDDLKDSSGKPLPWSAVKGEKLKNVYRKGIDSVEHLRSLEEGEQRVRVAQASIPTSGVAATAGTQANAGKKEFDAFIEDTGYDFSDEDANWLAVQFAEVPNTVMRFYASKSGGGKAIAEGTVRSGLKEIVKEYTKDVGEGNPFKDDQGIDKEAILRAIEQRYGMASGGLGALSQDQGPTVVEERTLPDGRTIQLLDDGTKRFKE